MDKRIAVIRKNGFLPHWDDELLLKFMEQERVETVRDAYDWARWAEEAEKDALIEEQIDRNIMREHHIAQDGYFIEEDEEFPPGIPPLV